MRGRKEVRGKAGRERENKLSLRVMKNTNLKTILGKKGSLKKHSHKCNTITAAD